MAFIHLSGSGDFDHVRLLGIAFRAIAETVVPSSEAAQLEIAIVEACNNIVEHVYAHQIGIITMDIQTTSEKFIVHLRDTGSPVPSGLQLASSPLDFDTDNLNDLPEGGFGLFLIDTIIDERRYWSENGINTLTLTKNLQRS